MNQPSLFDILEPPRPPRVMNYDIIRKFLNHQLRTMRTAQHMPWSHGEEDYHAKNFPVFAAELPAEEAADLVAQFQVQWARLKTAG